MTDPIQLLSERLHGWRQAGPEQWEARCPAHDDKQASLSVSRGVSKPIVLHCHAGCAYGDILSALRIDPAEVSNSSGASAPKPKSKAPKGKVYATPEEAHREGEWRWGQREGHWCYSDRDGVVIAWVLRWAGKDGAGKQIRPCVPADGGWVLAGIPEPRPLYQLPELRERAGEVVYVVEGEKAADAGRKLGLLCTTSPGGAKAAKKADWSALKGRTVIILPDADDPGEQYAAEVSKILKGHKAQASIVRLPALTDGDDLYDWVERGGTREQLEGVRAEESKSDSDKDNEWAEWTDTLLWRYDKHGERAGLRRDGLNAARIFAHDQRWGGVLAFDEAAQAPCFAQAPPFSEDYAAADRAYPTPIGDDDLLRIGYWLAEKWGLSLGVEMVAGAVAIAAHARRIHPLRDYLDSLRWDGTERVNGWLRTYMGAQPFAGQQPVYLDWVGRWWLISAVARAYRPGCKADHVLVLEGNEGVGKSSALHVLGGAAFADTQVNIGDKDAYLHIRGKWIVELAELDSLMRAESSTAKAFFTSSIDRYRAPYARSMIEVPRTCVFAGSVNHTDYIRDASGGRRYWPVLCGRIDLEGLTRDRDQLWAEAAHLYQHGEHWWPEGDAQRAMLREEQEARQVDDPWETPIQDFLLGKSQATPTQILKEALGIELERQGRREQTRIGILMQRLGWTRKRDRAGFGMCGKLATYYEAPNE